MYSSIWFKDEGVLGDITFAWIGQLSLETEQFETVGCCGAAPSVWRGIIGQTSCLSEHILFLLLLLYVSDPPTHPTTVSQGVEPGSESVVSVTPDPLLGTVFQTTSIKSVTLAFSSVALKLNYFVEHTFASFC